MRNEGVLSFELGRLLLGRGMVLGQGMAVLCPYRMCDR